jgi:hypothetical protein
MLAYFGITDSGVNLAINLLVLVLVVVYFALIYWVFADARRRIADPILIGCAVFAAFFPYIGPLVYMIVRPPEFLEDVRERELEMQAAEARLAQLSYLLCANCDYEVDKEFLVCPNCLHRLKDPCGSCGKPLDPSWSLCPYCETAVPGATPSRRSRRRREEDETAAQSYEAPLSDV